MKRFKLLVTLSALASLLAVTAVMAAPGGVTDPDALKALAKARQATTQYHDVDQATADGYAPTPGCVAAPGIGGMGVHYANFGLVADPAIDAATPEVLVYEPKGDRFQLAAVEYLKALGPPGSVLERDADGNPTGNVVFPDGSVHPIPPAPSLFGQTFEGPMDSEFGAPGGHSPVPHYDLHVWLWQANPDGIFADFNPNVKC